MQVTQPSVAGESRTAQRAVPIPTASRGVDTFTGSRVPDRAVLAGLVALATANGLLWVFTIPFNEAPDEAAHFQVVRFILDHGRLPVFHPDEIWLHNTSKGVVESYAPFPPLAYVLGALATRLTEGVMWGARFVSVVSYVATVALTYLIAIRLGLAAVVGACAALVVAFLPQFAFTAAYVNSDAIGVALSALLIYLLTWLRNGSRPSPGAALTAGPVPPTAAAFSEDPPGRASLWPRSRLVPSGKPPVWLLMGIGATAGALLLTKYPFYPVAAVALVVACLYVRRPLPMVALAVGVVATSGWWFVRNWLLYQEPVPVRIIADAKAAAGGNTLFVPADYGITLLDLSTRTDFWWATYTSFVGKFGFLTIELHPAWYIGGLVLLALAIAGAVARLFGGRAVPDASRDTVSDFGEHRPPRHNPSSAGLAPTPLADAAILRVAKPGLAAVLVGLAIVAGTALFAMASSAYGEYSPQGRYLFGALVPIALGLAVGWTELGRLTAALRWTPIAAVLVLVALNFAALGSVVTAHFLGNVESVIVQVDPSTVTGSPDLVAGWALAQGRSAWAPFSLAAVTEYRAPATEVRVYEGAPPPTGTLVGIAQYGLRRDDVADFHGGFPTIEAVGYQFDVSGSDAANPARTIYICASVTGGREPSLRPTARHDCEVVPKMPIPGRG